MSIGLWSGSSFRVVSVDEAGAGKKGAGMCALLSKRLLKERKNSRGVSMSRLKRTGQK